MSSVQKVGQIIQDRIDRQIEQFDKKSMDTNHKFLKQTNATILIQKWYRGHRSRIATKKYYKRMNERRKIIQQLVVTEEKYVHDLTVIISDFQMELFNSKIIPSSQVYLLFSNIDAIRKLNQHFFIILHSNFTNYWHYKVVFENVKKQVSFFKIYFEYLNNFTNSMTLMKELKDNNSKFKTFLINLKRNPIYGNLDLQDYLIKPVQRLPKYVLLLKLLLKKTDTTHPDYPNIKKLLQGFEEVNTSNNQKLNKLINNFKLTSLEKQAKLPFHITQPGTQFIMEENVTLLTSYNQVQDAVLYLLNNRVILTKRTKYQLKFIESVSFRYGVTIMENQQQLYQNCFTLQSIDGDSITLLFQTQEEMHKIMKQLKQQIILTQKKTYEKYAALQNINKVSESFINKMCRYDLMPEVSLLGTEERTDKMLKYTTYIVEVKVKNIRQKIFLRYSELLEAQQLISFQFPNLEIKQSLYKTTWFLNHKPKTIEERKMSIQKFLTQILSKPQIIQSGAAILSKLGLPQDFYDLPQKLKTSESFLKRSSIVHGSKVPKSERQTKDREGGSVNTKTRNTYRLSIFMDLEDESRKMPRKHSMRENTKSSMRSSIARNKLNVEEILFANELDLGHYVRYSENIQCIPRNKLKLQIYIPWLSNSKILAKKSIQIMENQRVATLINKLARQIGLNYHKDFRLFLEKDHAQRMLDDDEIILKVERELLTGKYNLVLKKMIYIERDVEDREIKSNRIRLKIIASQVIYDVKRSKYRLNYSKFLALSVLIGIIQNESIKNKGEIQFSDENSQNRDSLSGSCSVSSMSNSQLLKKSRSQDELRVSSLTSNRKKQKQDVKQLAIKTRSMISNSYASFFQNEKVWVKDYQECYKNLTVKLKKIAKDNSYVLPSDYCTQDEQLIWTSITDLSFLSILDQMRTDKMFGSMGYVVQISETFQSVLIEALKPKDGKKQDKDMGLDLETMESRNVWLIVKWSSILLYSINLASKLYEIKYDEIENVICYPSSIYIHFKDKLESKICPSTVNYPETLESRSELYEKEALEYYGQESTLKNSSTKNRLSSNGLNFPNSIKFKTTSSYVIRELINYYKNYNTLSKKIEEDEDFTNSLIEMINENSKVLNDCQDSFKQFDSFLNQSPSHNNKSVHNKSSISNTRDKLDVSLRASNIKMQQAE